MRWIKRPLRLTVFAVVGSVQTLRTYADGRILSMDRSCLAEAADDAD